MNAINSTVEIPGYVYKVTMFDSYDEADNARETAIYENDAVTTGIITAYNTHYTVLLYTIYGDSYYL